MAFFWQMRLDFIFVVQYPQIKKAREKRALIKFGNTLKKVFYFIESGVAFLKYVVHTVKKDGCFFAKTGRFRWRRGGYFFIFREWSIEFMIHTFDSVL